jgi:hypothetical protein
MEARKTHLRHMAGTQVTMLMQPSMGIRDDILRAGGTLKDHMKINRKALRELQVKNKEKKQVITIKLILKKENEPKDEPFKMKQFSDMYLLSFI